MIVYGGDYRYKGRRIVGIPWRRQSVLSPGLSKREREILRLIKDDMTISVPELSEKLNVSTTTVRSDLTTLATRGVIFRSRGCVIPAFHPNIIAKLDSRMEAKLRIAKAAADLVKDNDTIMIGAGTTANMVAQFLLGKPDVKVITHSTLILPYARTNPGLHLTLLGGEFRPSTESVVGPQTLEELQKFHARVALLGTDGLTLEQGLTSYLIEDAAIQKRMAEGSEIVSVVADSSKFGQKGFVAFFPINRINILISDAGLPSEFAEALREMGIQVILV